MFSNSDNYRPFEAVFLQYAESTISYFQGIVLCSNDGFCADVDIDFNTRGMPFVLILMLRTDVSHEMFGKTS